MRHGDRREVWDEYHARKKAQRMKEAAEMCKHLEDGGADEETVLALDFVHFGSDRAKVTQLAGQLEENYELEVTEGSEEGYWLVKGTTRPYGVTMSRDEHLGWVEFMFDAAQSHGCLFSTWSVEAPALGVKFDSADMAGDR